jgi:hypothetical protein
MPAMDAIDKAREFIASERSHPDAAIMATLIQALQDEGPFDLGALYRLALDRFELALQILEDWRLQRYYLGGASPAAAQVPH